jgi:preprotein translocase subunit SecG
VERLYNEKIVLTRQKNGVWSGTTSAMLLRTGVGVKYVKGGNEFMKKVSAIILTLLFFVTLSFAVVGCKKAEEQKPAETTAPAPAPAPAPEATPAPAPAPAATK